MPAFNDSREAQKLSTMLDDWLRILIEKGDDHWAGRSAQAIPHLLQFLAPKQVGDVAYDGEEGTKKNQTYIFSIFFFFFFYVYFQTTI
jgi:hypothetical protein